MAGRRLRLLTGCTATGKSAAAMAWAEATGGELLSCDALLFYRGMDVGTAKPSLADRARVPHHLIDLLPVAEAMDVGRFTRLALAAAEEITARGKPILVVGGSGFYLQTFLRPVTDEIAVPATVREAVERVLAEGGVAAVLAELRGLNPGGLGSLDTANPRRLTRALERCLASGLDLGTLRRRFEAQRPPFAGWEIDLREITLPPAALDRRIASRTEAMLGSGLLEEVVLLRSMGLERNPSATRAIGYRECLAVLDGRLPRAGLAAAINASTRALVKKQRTWFRTQLPPHPAVEPQDFSLTW